MLIRWSKIFLLESFLSFCVVYIAESQVHFIFKENTGTNATIAVPVAATPNIAGIPIVPGDEIGIFAPSGLCTGAIIWNGTNAVITCWGDDVQTAESDGMHQNELMRFRLWQQSTGIEYKVVAVTFSDGDSLYKDNGIYLLSSFHVDGAVAIEASPVTPLFIPGTQTVVARLSFNDLHGSPIIQSIRIIRSGTASDFDVPSVRLIRDLNRNDIVDGEDVLLDSVRHFTAGISLFHQLTYSPEASENLLVVLEVSPDAVQTKTTSVFIDSTSIIGSEGTQINFSGVTTPNYPLHMGIMQFIASVNNNQVVLEWKNSSDANTYGFTVQRHCLSNDERDVFNNSVWSEISTILRISSLAGFQQYSYIDIPHAAGSYCYRLKHIDRDGGSFYTEQITVEVLLPSSFALEQNFPNPFNPVTTIEYRIPFASEVHLTIVDLLGRVIDELVKKAQNAGTYSVKWDATVFPSGMYFYRLDASFIDQGVLKNYRSGKRMMVLK